MSTIDDTETMRQTGRVRLAVGSNEQTDYCGSSNDILILKQAFHRLSKRLVFIETFLKDKFRMFNFITFILASLSYLFLSFTSCTRFPFFHRLSELLYFRLPAEHEFMKPNVVFHGQSEDQLEEIIETSSSLSSPCSTHHQTRAKTRARTVHEESRSTNVAEKENQEEAPQVESTEESEEREDPLRQLTIDETCSLPENFHFPIIDDLEVKLDLDRGSLSVYFTA
jgi:hypothetical protein